MRLTSLSVLICLALAIGCGKKDSASEDGSPTGGGGVSAGGAGNDGGGAQNDAGSAGASGNPDAGTPETDGGSGGSGSVDAPPAIAELAAKMAGGVCAALLDCLGPTKLSKLVGGEDCAARVKLEFLAREFSYLQGAIDKGNVVIDGTALDSCVAGIEALGCDIETFDFPADCEKAIEGKVAVGDPCQIGLECAGTAFCKSNTCPDSVCTALLGAGDDCEKDEECGDNLLCIANVCKAPGKNNASCAGTTGNVCALGWSCWDGTDTVAGTCHTNAETLAKGDGEVCTPGSVLCMEGLSCAYTGSGTEFRCKKPVASGAACYQSLGGGLCPKGEYCNGTPTVEGTCVPLPGDGEPCVASNGTCTAGMACVPDTTKTAICRPIHDNGGSCKINAACRSNYCNAAKCAAPLTCK